MALDIWQRKLGTAQGRIEPTNWSPIQGDYVVCLGADAIGTVERVDVGDYVQIVQSDDLGSSIALRFSARTRGPLQLPRVVLVTAAAAGLYSVTINGTAHSYTAVSADSDVTIANALVVAVNAGTEPVTALLTGEADQLQLTADDPDTDYTLAVVGSLAAHTVWWTVQMLVGGVVFFTQTVLAGRTRNRADGGGMIRNEQVAGGDHSIAFRLQLEGSAAAVAIEAELPAFYIDNVTLEP